MTLADFLLARIQDDEDRARVVFREVSAGMGGTYEYVVFQPVDSERYLAAPPDRVLAECEAKREIVRSFQRTLGITNDAYTAGWRDSAVAALAHLAKVYDWHPEYRSDWTD